MNANLLSFLFLGIVATSAWIPQAKADMCVLYSATESMHSSRFKANYLRKAHEMAESLHPEIFKDKKLKYFKSDGTDLGLLNALEKAKVDGCRVVIGLYTSRECLLSGKFLKKHSMIGISPSCGHSKIQEYQPHLFTGVPPISAYGQAIADYLNKTKNETIIVVQPTDIYSQHFKNMVVNNLKIPYRIVEVDKEGATQGDLQINPKIRQNIFFSIYPNPSYKFLETLKIKKLLSNNLSIVGSPSWVFDLSVLKKQAKILNLVSTTVVTEVWDPETAAKTDFYTLYQKEQGYAPENLAIFSYDITKLAMICRQKSGSAFDSKKFIHCLRNEPFAGITGSYKYDPDSAFPNKKVMITDLKKRLNSTKPKDTK